jgi:hypothetical protein
MRFSFAELQAAEQAAGFSSSTATKERAAQRIDEQEGLQIIQIYAPNK